MAVNNTHQEQNPWQKIPETVIFTAIAGNKRCLTLASLEKWSGFTEK